MVNLVPTKETKVNVQASFQSPEPAQIELHNAYSSTWQIGRGQCTVQAIVVKRYSKGRYGRHKSKWSAYAVTGLPVGILPAQVFELYRQCFGIESSYRQMNQVRARTSTRNPVIRLLLVGLAFVLFNLYISLRQNLSSALKQPLHLPKRFWLSLRRLALLLSHALERLWGTTEVIQHQPCVTLSSSTDSTS